MNTNGNKSISVSFVTAGNYLHGAVFLEKILS